MWSWIRDRRDPFTRRIDLERYRPFTFSHDQAVRFQAANGSHWLLPIRSTQAGVEPRFMLSGPQSRILAAAWTTSRNFHRSTLPGSGSGKPLNHWG